MIKKIVAVLTLLILITVLLSHQNYIQFTDYVTETYLKTFTMEDYNVIVISIDTLRADHLGVYGYERDTSPNIDDFAEDSLVFEYTYTTRPKTSPAFASLLTGNYEYMHNVTDVFQKIGPENVLLSEILKDNGYRTGAIVSTPVLSSVFGFNQGFDDYEETKDLKDEVTTKSADWLRDNYEEKFFLWTHYVKPHRTYEPVSPYKEMFIEDEYYGINRIRLNRSDGASYIGEINNNAMLDDNDNLYYYISQYDGEIAYVDHEVGNLLKTIEELGLFENSIIVLTADHGESLGDHNYYFEHGELPYDACSRIPMIIRLPGTMPGTIETPVSLIDITPTILDLLNIENRPEMEGHSIVPLLTHGEYPEYVYTISGYEVHPQISVRKGGWKLIYIPDENDRSLMNNVEYEFYNTRDDPNELVNLAASNFPVYYELKEEMNKWTETWENEEYYLQKNISIETMENMFRLLDKTESDTDLIERIKSLGYIS